MTLPLRDGQHVMAKPVCVNGFICSDAEPRAAYVYVRVTHRGESERCVASSRRHSSDSIIQIQQQMKRAFLFEGRERELETIFVTVGKQKGKDEFRNCFELF